MALTPLQVRNFITKRDFEGFDMTYQYTSDQNTGEGATGTLSMLLGVQGDQGGIIASASTMDRGEINVADDYERFGGSTLSTGQPGRFLPVLVKLSLGRRMDCTLTTGRRQ